MRKSVVKGWPEVRGEKDWDEDREGDTVAMLNFLLIL
jgi:hypothetical protein